MSVSEKTAPDLGRALGGKQIACGIIFTVALVVSIVVPIFGAPGIWGLVPVAVFAVLALLGMDIVLATLSAILLGAVMARMTPLGVADLLADSLGSFIATIGLIIVLGAGVGEIAARTGAAARLVQAIVNRIGVNSQARVKVSIMVASLLICAALGTLAGGNAIIAPVVIPVAAAVGLKRPVVAALFQTAGASGLVLGPFTPNVITVTGLTGISYPQYLLVAGLPMAIATLIAGWIMAIVIQKKAPESELYDAADQGAVDSVSGRKASSAAIGFSLTLIVMSALGIIFQAGYAYAILVMIVLAAVTGLLGGLKPVALLKTFYEGAGKLVWMFFLFWLFNAVLVLVDGLNAYQSLLDAMHPWLALMGGAMLAVVILWFNVVGHIPGAAVAQMTFTAKIFGPLLAAAGVGPVGMTLVILGSSQIDWFGPFPTSDMFGQMGLARSRQIKYMLYNGWAVVALNLIVLSVLLLFVA